MGTDGADVIRGGGADDLRGNGGSDLLTGGSGVDVCDGGAGADLTFTCDRPPNPGDAVDCSDFVHQTDAQDWFDRYFPHYGDVADLDPDGDGAACEELPGR